MKRIIAVAIAGMFCAVASAADTTDTKATYADIEATFAGVRCARDVHDVAAIEQCCATVLGKIR